MTGETLPPENPFSALYKKDTDLLCALTNRVNTACEAVNNNPELYRPPKDASISSTDEPIQQAWREFNEPRETVSILFYSPANPDLTIEFTGNFSDFQKKRYSGFVRFEDYQVYIAHYPQDTKINRTDFYNTIITDHGGPMAINYEPLNHKDLYKALDEEGDSFITLDNRLFVESEAQAFFRYISQVQSSDSGNVAIIVTPSNRTETFSTGFDERFVCAENPTGAYLKAQISEKVSSKYALLPVFRADNTRIGWAPYIEATGFNGLERQSAIDARHVQLTMSRLEEHFQDR